MKVGDLQRFVSSLGALFASRQGQPQADMVALGAALDPFKDLSLPEFTGFLGLAKEYKETGKIDVPTGRAKKAPAARVAKVPKAPKTPLKTKTDAAAIQLAVDELESLYSRVADPELAYATIETVVARIHDEFDPGGLKEVTKGFGLSSGLNSKKACREKIEHKIKERKARNDRGEVIATAARTEPTAQPASHPVRDVEVVEATVVDEQPIR